MNIDDLKKRILIEFEATELPKPDNIAVFTDWDSDLINRDFSQFLDKSVDVSILVKHSKSLPAFSPEAFVFFIKDYMLYALDNVESELTEHLIYRLGSLEVGNEYWDERVSLFNYKQVKVISDFCLLLAKLMPESEHFLKERLEKATVTWGEAIRIK